ncbi:sensor histidine kinase [Colwelliaceae bacterium MEBiC 14330]
MRHVPSRIKAVASLISVKSLLVIFFINTSCAFLRTIYHLTVVESSFDYFFSEFYGYFKSMNTLGYALAFSYFILSRGPDSKMSITRISMIGLLAFVVSFPFVFITGQPWNESSFHPVVQVTSYSLSTLIFSAWAIMLIIYIQSRESQPKFQMLKQQIAEQSIERERVEMELHLLQAQIEPHFFYNTLANLHNLIDYDAERAKNLLEELTEYLRSTVHQYRHKYITISEEAEMVKRYLNIQKIRFGDQLSYQIDIPEEVKHFAILPMSLLTLVENAIKHAVEKNNGQGHVLVCTQLKNKETLLLSVTDDVGILQGKSYGTGISNLIARLEVSYGSRASFNIHCIPEVNTCAQLEVPTNG